jgi:hypothetical protein
MLIYLKLNLNVYDVAQVIEIYSGRNPVSMCQGY